MSRTLFVTLTAAALLAGCTSTTRTVAVADPSGGDEWSDREGDYDTESLPGSVVLLEPINLLEPEVRPVPRQAGRRPAGFSWPTEKPEITSRWMARRGRRRHQGINLRARNGTPLLASESGRVTFSGYQGGYGKIVIITHADGLETRYAHASKLLVRRGQRVRRGQLIARAGRTGNARGPHCHFEIRHNGRPINPIRVLEPLG